VAALLVVGAAIMFVMMRVSGDDSKPADQTETAQPATRPPEAPQQPAADPAMPQGESRAAETVAPVKVPGNEPSTHTAKRTQPQRPREHVAAAAPPPEETPPPKEPEKKAPDRQALLKEVLALKKKATDNPDLAAKL